MSSSSSSPAHDDQPIESTLTADPYKLTADKIQEPPRDFKASLRFLGPGMITSAAVVGSGELLTATALGAKAGFMLLWLVLVSTFIKVFVQIEVARYSISTGEPGIAGYNHVPPKLFKRGWISYLAVLMFMQFLTSQAGVLAAGALAMSMMVPVGGDPFSAFSLGYWVVVQVVVAIAIHFTNKYSIVETVSTVLVVIVTFAVVVMVFGIQFTPFAWSGSDIAEGMRFQIATGAMGLALGMFGLTGVGAGEITSYSFWCVEKGYAAWTGPNDGSEAWAERARGWIRVMKLDAWVAWVVYTLSTASFYILGAAVLNPQGLQPEGNQVMVVISRIFTDTVGQWAGGAFLVFAAVALFKTILANVPSLSRQVVLAFSLFNLFDWTDRHARDKWLRATMVLFPIVWGILAISGFDPLTLVVLGGILNALYLMAVSVATLYLSWRVTDPRIKDGMAFNIMLIVSAIAVFAVGAVTLL